MKKLISILFSTLVWFPCFAAGPNPLPNARLSGTSTAVGTFQMSGSDQFSTGTFYIGSGTVTYSGTTLYLNGVAIGGGGGGLAGFVSNVPGISGTLGSGTLTINQQSILFNTNILTGSNGAVFATNAAGYFTLLGGSGVNLIDASGTGQDTGFPLSFASNGEAFFQNDINFGGNVYISGNIVGSNGGIVYPTGGQLFNSGTLMSQSGSPITDGTNYYLPGGGAAFANSGGVIGATVTGTVPAATTAVNSGSATNSGSAALSGSATNSGSAALSGSATTAATAATATAYSGTVGLNNVNSGSSSTLTGTIVGLTITGTEIVLGTTEGNAFQTTSGTQFTYTGSTTASTGTLTITGVGAATTDTLSNNVTVGGTLTVGASTILGTTSVTTNAVTLQGSPCRIVFNFPSDSLQLTGTENEIAEFFTTSGTFRGIQIGGITSAFPMVATGGTGAGASWLKFVDASGTLGSGALIPIAFSQWYNGSGTAVTGTFVPPALTGSFSVEALTGSASGPVLGTGTYASGGLISGASGTTSIAGLLTTQTPIMIPSSNANAVTQSQQGIGATCWIVNSGSVGWQFYAPAGTTNNTVSGTWTLKVTAP